MARPRAVVVVLLAVLVMGGLVAGAAGVTAGPGDGVPYVALGDSYTAGPLIPNQLRDPAGCWRSDHNYPHVLARALATPFRDVSCSGATTGHLSGPQTVAGGVNPPQLDALGPGTRLVTVGISGNDVGFASILQTCFAPAPLGTPCQDAHVGPAGDGISADIAGAAPKVAAVLAEIRARAPLARVVVVGYPAILPHAGPGCWPVMPVAPGDLDYLRSKERELGAMLAGQAAAAGALFVDAYQASVGRDACALPLVRWVEPLVPLAPAFPVHPNAVGMQAVADLVLRELARVGATLDPAVDGAR